LLNFTAGANKLLLFAYLAILKLLFSLCWICLIDKVAPVTVEATELTTSLTKHDLL